MVWKPCEPSMFARFFLKKFLTLPSFPSLPAMRLLLLVALCLACWHCQSPCEPPADQVAIIKFMDYNTKKALPDSLRFWKIALLNGSRVFKDTLIATRLFGLPLSPAVDALRYSFDSNNGKSYTFTVQYTRTPKIGSNNPDCGVAIDYSSLTLTNHNADSLVTVSSNIITNNATTPNFVLYIKP